MIRVLTVLVVLAASVAAAQINTGEISGVVRDSVGGVLPGAAIVATHTATRIVIERTTDSEGRFFLPALRLGQWTIEARLSGLQPQTLTIVVEVGRTLTVDFSLSVQGLTEQVSVQRTFPLLQLDDGGDQRRHREPRGGAAPAERPQLPRARAVERRRRDSARRDARRGAAAGRPAAECRRPAIRAQHLSARRHQGHRRVVQQPRDQSVGGLDRGVQDPEVDVSR